MAPPVYTQFQPAWFNNWGGAANPFMANPFAQFMQAQTAASPAAASRGFFSPVFTQGAGLMKNLGAGLKAAAPYGLASIFGPPLLQAGLKKVGVGDDVASRAATGLGTAGTIAALAAPFGPPGLAVAGASLLGGTLMGIFGGGGGPGKEDIPELIKGMPGPMNLGGKAVNRAERYYDFYRKQGLSNEQALQSAISDAAQVTMQKRTVTQAQKQATQQNQAALGQIANLQNVALQAFEPVAADYMAKAQARAEGFNRLAQVAPGPVAPMIAAQGDAHMREAQEIIASYRAQIAALPSMLAQQNQLALMQQAYVQPAGSLGALFSPTQATTKNLQSALLQMSQQALQPQQQSLGLGSPNSSPYMASLFQGGGF